MPLLQRQFPEITDFYLPPEDCSYRMALVQIKKAYPGHALRVMMGVWSHLRQFLYYPGQQDGAGRHQQVLGETQRKWGRTVTMDAQVQARMNGIFDTLDL